MVAGVFHILNHATFKASLFMAAGIIDHEIRFARHAASSTACGSSMPITGDAGDRRRAAQWRGFRCMNGFLSKEMFFAETLARRSASDASRSVVPGAGCTLARCVLASPTVVRFVHDVFFNGQPVGPDEDTARTAALDARCRSRRWSSSASLVGILPALTIGPLLAVAAAGALRGPLPEYSLAIWHGVNLPLLMSVIAIVGGAAFYVLLQKSIDLHSVERLPVDGKHVFDAILKGVQAVAERAVRMLPHGSLPGSLLWIVLVAVLAAGAPLARAGFNLPRRMARHARRR